VKSWEREVSSHFVVIGEFFRLAREEDASLHPSLREELERYMRVRLDRGKWIPEEVTTFHSEWYREFYRVLGVRDPYRSLKERSEELARELLAELAPRSLEAALRAAVVANRLDFGVARREDDPLPLAVADFADLERRPLWIDDGARLAERLEGARHVLLLADNAGEALFDLHLLRVLRARRPGCRLSIAAKAGPMLNDVTADELAAQGAGELATVVSTGTNAFGVPEREASAEFAACLADADLVLAKGQAHLEFWIRFGEPRLFHLAHTKFAVLDPALGRLPAGVDLVLSAERYAEGRPAWRRRPAGAA